MPIRSQARTKRRDYVDTLRISEEDYRRILGQLDQPATVMKALTRRHNRRYSHAVRFAIRIQHPGGTDGNFIGRTRDVSAGGVAFLHGSFLHMNTRCQVLLPGRDGRWLGLAGTVVRCRYIEGNVHEVGVQFQTPVDLSTVIDVCDEPDLADDSASAAG